MHKYGFFFLFFLLLSFPLFSQEVISASLPTEPIALKTVFSIEFEVETEDVSQLIVSGLTLFPFASLYEYPRITKKEWNKNFYSVRVRFLAQKTGRYLLDGIVVHTIEKDFPLAPQLIEIGVWEGRKVKVPLEFRWVIDSSVHFEQEAFPVRLELVNHPSKEFLVGKIDFHSPSLKKGVVLEKFNQPTAFSEMELAGKKLYSFTVAHYLVSFPGTGEQFLPSGMVIGENRQGSFSSLGVLINPLPYEKKEGEAPVEAIGYHFSYQYELKKRESTVGDFFTLVVTLSGCGNLNKIVIPQPHIHGMAIAHHDNRVSYNITAAGFQGFQSSQWVISGDKIGEFLLYLPDLYWFNLAKRRVEKIPGESISLKVFSQAESESMDRPFLKVMGWNDIQKASRTGLAAENLNYILFLPAVLCFLIGLILFFKNRKRWLLFSLIALLSTTALSSKTDFEQLCDEGLLFYSQGAFQEAKDFFLEAMEKSPGNAALHFNVALCSYRLEQAGDAVFYSRKAVTFHPAKKRYRAFALFLEREYDLPYQYSLPFPIQLDWFFIIAVVISNLGGILSLLLGFFPKKTSPKILLLVMFIMLLGISILFGMNHQIKTKELIVVSQPGKALLTLHSKTATPILSTPAGTTLRVIGEYEEYYIAKSNLGFEGWICKEDVINTNQL